MFAQEQLPQKGPSSAPTLHPGQLKCVPYFEHSARRYARFTPRFRLPKAFPDNKSGTHNPILTDAAAMHIAPDNHVFEDINVEFPDRHGRAHDPKTFSYSDG